MISLRLLQTERATLLVLFTPKKSYAVPVWPAQKMHPTGIKSDVHMHNLCRW